MKKLITAVDIKERAAKGDLNLVIDRQTIITPSARDAAREFGVNLLLKEQTALQKSSVSGNTTETGVIGQDGAPKAETLVEQICRQVAENCPDTNLVALVVKEVLAHMNAWQTPPQPLVERDAAGLRLVRGRSVICKPFDTGKPGDHVSLLDLLPVKESPRMAAGFITMEKSSFEWELRYDEYDYIIEGTLEITVNGNTYRGEAGDVFYIPRGSKIIFGCPDKVKFFYVTYPANWQEV